MSEESLEINLFGRTYFVAATESETDTILEATKYLNDQMHSVSSKIKASGFEDTLVMTAINTTYMLIKKQKQLEAQHIPLIEDQLSHMIQKINTVLEP